jgi:hypothetical protein
LFVLSSRVEQLKQILSICNEIGALGLKQAKADGLRRKKIV